MERHAGRRRPRAPPAPRAQELFQRDREMSELIDSFDRLKAEELHKTQAAQKEIVRLLQTLARKLEHMENPSRLNASLW